jgi:outer membrane cobalamin receptor
LILAILLWASATADAATLSGIVMDPDGRRVARAEVLIATPVAVVDRVTTDEAGEFLARDLPAGRYEIRVSMPGFRAEPLTVGLAANDNRRVEVALRVSAISEAVMVTGAQVDVPLSRLPEAATVLDAPALAARHFFGVADALRLVPGLAVTGNGGLGTVTSLFPRGADSDGTLVLVDGIRMNAFGGGFDFGHLALPDVERLEVVRGPQSALYGSDAIGAVVQVVTRHGGPTRANAFAEYGSQATARISGGAAGPVGPWRWGGGVERLASDGFEGTAPATGERVTNDDYDRTALTANGAWESGRGTEIRGDLRVEANERGFPGPYGQNPAGNFGGVDRVSRGENDTLALAGAIRHAWTPSIQQRGQISVADFDGSFVSPFGHSMTETRRWSGRTLVDFVFAHRAAATVGVELQRERGASTFIVGGAGTPVPVRRNVAGYFGEGRFDLADRVSITAGLRVEQIRRDRLERDGGPFGFRPAFDAHQVVSANPKVTVAWFLEPVERRGQGWTRIRASAGTGIRAPDAFEIAFTDNPGLEPERSRSLDVAVERGLAGGRVVVEAIGFFSRFDDLIVAVGRSLQDASRFQTDNISNARARGLELQATARADWGFEARASYTWLDAQILAVDRGAGQAPAPFQVGDRLLRRPRHQGFVDLLYSRERFTIGTRVGARGRVLDVEPNFGAPAGLFDAAGFAVADLNAGIRLLPGIQAVVRVQNLFDRAYEESFGFPAPGRTASIGVRIAASR